MNNGNQNPKETTLLIIVWGVFIHVCMNEGLNNSLGEYQLTSYTCIHVYAYRNLCTLKCVTDVIFVFSLQGLGGFDWTAWIQKNTESLKMKVRLDGQYCKVIMCNGMQKIVLVHYWSWYRGPVYACVQYMCLVAQLVDHLCGKQTLTGSSHLRQLIFR